MLGIASLKRRVDTGRLSRGVLFFISGEKPEYKNIFWLYLGFITNPKNGEVKALSVRVP